MALMSFKKKYRNRLNTITKRQKWRINTLKRALE